MTEVKRITLQYDSRQMITAHLKVKTGPGYSKVKAGFPQSGKVMEKFAVMEKSWKIKKMSKVMEK